MVIFKPHYLRMPYNFIDFTLSSYFVYVDNRSICYVLWSLFSCWTTISYIRMDCKFKISRYCWRTLRCFTWHWTVNGASIFFSQKFIASLYLLCNILAWRYLNSPIIMQLPNVFLPLLFVGITFSLFFFVNFI